MVPALMANVAWARSMDEVSIFVAMSCYEEFLLFASSRCLVKKAHTLGPTEGSTMVTLLMARRRALVALHRAIGNTEDNSKLERERATECKSGETRHTMASGWTTKPTVKVALYGVEDPPIPENSVRESTMA
jgi:hypothetical protein